MRTAHVVIGSAFGDEGKGLMTDYLARQNWPDARVVRFNGGAQAGHTVQLENGTRHVFHHVGSGTFAGASTHLSRFFVTNPFVLDDEIHTLAGLGVKPQISIDPRAPLTTPYDMIINQMAEEWRGVARHGSCGLGFNETLKRAEFRPDLATAVHDAMTSGFEVTLRAIRDEYVPWRLSELGVPLTPVWETRLRSDDLLRHYRDSVARFGDRFWLTEDAKEIAHPQVIFEGAQGLLLDENHFFFPHVTHSRTGLPNVLELAAEAGIMHLKVHYMMRAYMTRHGAGPFPSEDASMTFEDVTNQPNMWQGSLRFGALDLDLISEAISNDRATANESLLDTEFGITITCMDQIGERVSVRLAGKTEDVSADALPRLVEDVVGIPVSHLSFGPTHTAMREIALVQNGVA